MYFLGINFVDNKVIVNGDRYSIFVNFGNKEKNNMRIPASKQTISSLMQITRDSMAELEAVLPAMMKLRTQLTAIGSDYIDKTDTVLAFFSKVEDLFIGSHFVLHELMTSFRLLLDTSIVYEKRYHIQSINLCICEAYTYFQSKDDDGVWSLLKPYISSLDNPILQSYVLIIDNELEKLDIMYCDKVMRNSTAHYDKPIRRYDLQNSITDENIYCKAVSQFMLLHMRISQISTIIFAIISQITPNKSLENIEQEKPILDIKAFIEEKLADKFSSNEELANISSESLAKVSNNIDSMYNNHLKIASIKEYFETKIQTPTSIDILHQIILLRIMISFIRCDLTCAIRAYMSSKSSIERSLHLRRIYLIEVSALTHLYGYNEKKRTRSLWGELTFLDIENDENELHSLNEKLEELTSGLDCTRRNLHTHFREDEKLNILVRYEAYKELNQIDEVSKAHNLLNLCKDIENYTMCVLTRIGRKEEQKTKEQEDKFNTMFENLRNMTIASKSSEAMKSQLIAMLDEMREKLTNLFDNKKDLDS